MELCAGHRREIDCVPSGSDVIDFYNRRCHAADVERYVVAFRPRLFAVTRGSTRGTSAMLVATP